MPRRIAFAAGIAAVCLAAGVSPASASVKLGAVPATTPNNTCTNLKEDWVQSGPATGNPYVVPDLAGSITSWSTQTSASANQVWTFKVFRHVTGTTYRVVGHDGPRVLTPGKLNTFKTDIAVMPGDLIGMNDNDTATPVSTSCAFVFPGATVSWFFGSLGDGQADSFGSTVADRRLNVEAAFEPRNRFTVSSVVRNRKRGTAVLTLVLPNPGELTAVGPGAKVLASQTQLFVKAKGAKKRKLNRKGRAKINLAITYVPTGGTARTQHAKFKLIKR